MKRLVLTDSLIRDALAPDPHVVAPAGLLAQVTADVARTPQRRTLGFPVLGQSRRLAWVALGAATLLVLLGTLLLAGGGRNPLEGEMLLPPAPSPTSSPLPQRLWVGSPAVTEIVGLSADEAWAAYGNQLWHRTAVGWSGPMSVNEDTADGVRGLDRIADGRIVVAAHSGIYVGSEAGWTQIWRSNDQSGELTNGVAVDAAGTIWAPGIAGTSSGLRSFREVDGTWRNEWHAGCPAGGLLAASAADGSVWTAGIDYSGTSGVARLDGGACTQLFPYGDDRKHDVVGITADGQGRVAVQVMDNTVVNDLWTGGRLAVWDNGQWTTLRQGETFRNNAWNALSYAPDGSLWVAFDDKLWRYDGTTGTPIRDAVPAAVSVAPDGTVWFVAKDAEGDGGEIERLRPDGAQAEPSPAQTPAPSASPVPQLKADGAANGAGFRLLGVDSERAWAAKSFGARGSGLWGRTSAGWTGPTGVDPRMQAAINSIADMGDGRLAIALDTGVWVGGGESWTRVWEGAASDVAMAPDGRLWVSGPGDVGASRLRALRETGAGWQQEWSGCQAGGKDVVIAADGSVWTAGITYTATGGVARATDGDCEELFPVRDGYEVMGLAASPTGAAAVLVVDPFAGDLPTSGRIVEWREGRWTELRAGEDLVPAGFGSLAYTPDGALWATFGERLHRYTDGSWQAITGALVQAPISVGVDGTVWYVRDDAIVDRVRLGDPNDVPVPHYETNPTNFDGGAAVMPVAKGEQWLVGPGSGKALVAWHGTPGGWTGPFVVEPDAADVGYPGSFIQLPDGRLAVATRRGIWAGTGEEWTRVRTGDTAGIAAGPDGTIWFGMDTQPGLQYLRRIQPGWMAAVTECEVGGGVVSVAADGTVWSGRTTWMTPATIVRRTPGRCEELTPLPGVGSQVLALAADPGGGVAAVLVSRADGGLRTWIMHWDGSSWTTLRDVAGSTDWASLAYTADGTLWMQWNQALARFMAGTWTDVTGTGGAGLRTTSDGTVWYSGEGGPYVPVDSLEIPNP